MADKHFIDARPPMGLRRRLKLHSPFATVRARVLLAVWVTLTLGVLAFVLAADLGRAKARVEHLGNDFLHHVADRALISETAIEGFAAFIASMGELDHDRAQAYARMLLGRYPFLYMFEVASRVSGAERAGLEQRLTGRYPGFHIKRFTYRADRIWQSVDPAQFYYPLVFQEPLLGGSEELVGLDIHSSDFLRLAMEASFVRGEPVATYPFELAEGGRGYVLHRAVDHLAQRPPSAFEAHEYVLLAVKSSDLFAGLKQAPPGVAVRLVHRDFDPDDPLGEVLSRPAQPVSAAESLILPRFRRDLVLNLTSQPFLLRLDWQLGWRDLSLGLTAAVLLGSLLLLWGVRNYARQYVEGELAALEREGRLYELANFDPLTGLANRNRLVDFLESALARARRHGQQLVVLFIDLDRFKEVNDSHGHATGDLVLVEVARRLSQHLREDELLARYGGDEFVWVTAGADRAPALDGLVDRLRREFEPPFVTRAASLRIGVSVGHAAYPRDGKNISALFEAADACMYHDKRRGHKGAGLADAVSPHPAAGNPPAS